MKTKEELNALKSEIEALNKKLAELSEDELVQVVGGQVVDPTRPWFGQDTRWDMICKVCGANFDSWWGPVPDNGDVIYRDCPSCGGKKTAWWVHVREI